ncbi:eukaryotic translation initiation factor SUI1 family protein [Acanthamoeba castellanii str. Neff]|uniref:Eukaryotic translation initiation factor SUI1 family protein n=1 Tax=Acanthamoeba castellanii (strain ATCC 30010 / Neff) TaxID=1257118 RepID=L8HES0_ACACF|nr:eukaryotic translation initiation factor SUI1 family protein [Acanthamoeba castellanii str. Neff]ELR24014.1 eukaryotic translation initiation factor SUI1 family protein [Acanthamoeba castellanii str. Neff]
MFKKAFKTQNRNKLKRSEHGWGDLYQVLPPKADIEVVKLGGGSRTVLYFVEAQPLFFDPSGRDDWVPTDLMLQGVVVPKSSEWVQKRPAFYGRWQQGSLRALCVKGNKAPIGVGHMLVSSETVERAGMQGKGVEMLHLFQDKLWYVGIRNQEAGTKDPHPLIEDDRFSKQAAEDEVEPPLADESAADAQEGDTSSTTTTTTDEATKNESDDGEGEGEEEEAAPTRRAAPDEDEVRAQNELLHHCFLAALKGGGERKVRDKDLPMLANVFYSDYMLPARPEGTTLEIKRTSYKKLHTFLAEAAGKGLIQTRETSPGVIQLTAVNRSHDEYKEFRVNKEGGAQQKEEAGEEQKGLHIEEIYKFTSALKPLLTAEAKPGTLQDDYWRAAEAKELLWAYVAREKLVPEKDKRVVRMDEYLAINVMGKKTFYGDLIDRKTLAEKFLGKLKNFSYVSRDGVGDVCKGAIAPVLIRTEQRQGRKVVTVLSGMETFLISADTLRTELAKKFAASTSMGDVEGKKNEGRKEILVQGDVIKATAEFLIQKYQVPKRFIQVMDKAGGGNKKGRAGR